MDVLRREHIENVSTWDVPYMGDMPPAPVMETIEPATPEPQQPLTVGRLEELEAEARREGYDAGFKEGLAAAKVEGDKVRSELTDLLRSISRPLTAMDERVETELARMAMMVARQIILSELTTSPDLVVEAVQNAVRMLPSWTGRLRVFLHPDDVNLLKTLEVTEKEWDLLADPKLQRGDCVLETVTSRLDARTETRIAAVVGRVLGADAEENHSA